MKYNKLGRTGLKVSEICLGTMQFGWSVSEPDSWTVLSKAVDAGINFIDTADVYTRWVEGNPGGVSEKIIGNWLKNQKISRDQLIIATKVRGAMGTGPNDAGLSRQHIMYSVEQSLKRLQTDYIDLNQTHSNDDTTPIEETMRALDDLIRQGKVRYGGCSNYSAWRLVEALWASDSRNLHRYESLQPVYSIVNREPFERDLETVCNDYQIGVIPYSPLAGGFLTGKYQKDKALPESVRQKAVQDRYISEKNWRILDAVRVVAESHNASISQISLAWLFQNRVITAPIIGPRNPDQLQDNLGAIEISLTETELKTLNSVSDWRS